MNIFYGKWLKILAGDNFDTFLCALIMCEKNKTKAIKKCKCQDMEMKSFLLRQKTQLKMQNKGENI